MSLENVLSLILVLIFLFFIVYIFNIPLVIIFRALSGMKYIKGRKFAILNLTLVITSLVTSNIEHRFVQYLITVSILFLYYIWNKKSRFSEGLYVSSLSVLIYHVFTYFIQDFRFIQQEHFTSDFIYGENRNTTFAVITAAALGFIIVFLLFNYIINKYQDRIRTFIINSIQKPIQPYIYSIIIMVGLYFFSVSTDSRIEDSRIHSFFNGNIEYLSFLILVFVLIFILYILNQHTQAEEYYYKKTMDSLTSYTSEIEALNKELAMFRHDYINLISSLELAIKEDDMDSVEDIYKKVLEPTKDKLILKDHEASQLNRVKNTELKSVIYLKMQSALNKDLKFFMDIPFDIDLGEDYDQIMIIRCLTILLDNAIEHNVEDGYVGLSMFNKDDLTYIVVKNSTDKSTKKTNKWYEPGYTSKEDNQRHGWGLDYINDQVRSSNSIDLETIVSNESFEQVLIYKNN